MKPSIRQEILQVIADHLAVPLEKVQPEARLIEDLEADSLDTMHLVTSLNHLFNIQLMLKNAEHIQTVDDLLNWVDQHLL